MEDERVTEWRKKMLGGKDSTGFLVDAYKKQEARIASNPFAQANADRKARPKRKKNVQHEAKPTKEIIEYIKLLGGFAWRNNTMGMPLRDATGRVVGMRPASIRGASDILGILPSGKFLAIEVKSAVGKATDDQQWFIGEITKRGGFAMVARSVGEVHDALKRLGLDKA